MFNWHKALVAQRNSMTGNQSIRQTHVRKGERGAEHAVRAVAAAYETVTNVPAAARPLLEALGRR